jgi:tRNA threonylcarbamoyladenosine biosynthesis protein TsaE
MDALMDKGDFVIVSTELEMEALGRTAGAVCRAGDVIALVGDLGAGKTCWSKGFVSGIGAVDAVSSPTFGIVHEYRSGRFPVFHFDFYRLSSERDLVDAGWDDYLDESGVVVVEWADKFPALMPPCTRWILIESLADGVRQVRW